MPRWVKVLLVVLGVVLVALVLVPVLSGGRHGPGMHSGHGAAAVAERR